MADTDARLTRYLALFAAALAGSSACGIACLDLAAGARAGVPLGQLTRIVLTAPAQHPLVALGLLALTAGSVVFRDAATSVVGGVLAGVCWTGLGWLALGLARS